MAIDTRGGGNDTMLLLLLLCLLHCFLTGLLLVLAFPPTAIRWADAIKNTCSTHAQDVVAAELPTDQRVFFMNKF